MSGVLPSATLLINEQSRKLACAGRKVYRFGFGQSPFPVLPAAVSALQAHASEKAYSAVQGLAELRQAAADFHNRRDTPAQWDADRVLVAPGSKLLLWASLTALQGRALSGADDPRFTRGARLLLPAPSWVSYAPQARLAGMSLEPLPGDAGVDHRWAPPVAVVDEQCGRAVAEGLQPVLLLNSPNNPTGQVLSSQQVADLADVAREHSAVVISDEIYGPLTFGEHTAFAAHYPERTITTSGMPCCAHTQQ
jgi:aspartate aminotransferase